MPLVRLLLLSWTAIGMFLGFGTRLLCARAILAPSVALAITQVASSAPHSAPEKEQARVERIESSLLAPCCYTEPLSRHQSEISVKMRLEIVKWVAEGKTDQTILGEYVKRYGAKVLVNPKTKPELWTSWIPWLSLAAGFGVVLWILKRWRAVPSPSTEVMSSSGTEVLVGDFNDDDLL